MVEQTQKGQNNEQCEFLTFILTDSFHDHFLSACGTRFNLLYVHVPNAGSFNYGASKDLRIGGKDLRFSLPTNESFFFQRKMPHPSLLDLVVQNRLLLLQPSPHEGRKDISVYRLYVGPISIEIVSSRNRDLGKCNGIKSFFGSLLLFWFFVQRFI